VSQIKKNKKKTKPQIKKNMESIFVQSIKTQLKAEQLFSYSGYSNNELAILAAFLKDYDSFRVAISRAIANNTQSYGSSDRANSITAYFSSNPYSAQDGLQKIAYFVSKARFFCANDVVDPRSNDGSFAIPATGAISAPYDSIGDYGVASNIYNDLMSAVQATPSLLNWVVANLTGQRDVDFFQPAFDAAATTTTTTITTAASNRLGLISYLPVIINKVGGSFSISLSNNNSTFALVNSTDPSSSSAQRTPNIAMTINISGTIAVAETVTISSQDIWLAGSSGATINPYVNSYFLCPSAYLVTVLYSSNVSSYLAFWFSKTGFYLQNGASLYTYPATQLYPVQQTTANMQATMVSTWESINSTNAYIQATTQQFGPETLYNAQLSPSSSSSFSQTWNVPATNTVYFKIVSPGGNGGNSAAFTPTNTFLDGFGGGSGAFSTGSFTSNGVVTLTFDGHTITLQSGGPYVSVSCGSAGTDVNASPAGPGSGGKTSYSTSGVAFIQAQGNNGVGQAGGQSVYTKSANGPGAGGAGGIVSWIPGQTTQIMGQGSAGQFGYIFITNSG